MCGVWPAPGLAGRVCPRDGEGVSFPCGSSVPGPTRGGMAPEEAAGQATLELQLGHQGRGSVGPRGDGVTEESAHREPLWTPRGREVWGLLFKHLTELHMAEGLQAPALGCKDAPLAVRPACGHLSCQIAGSSSPGTWTQVFKGTGSSVTKSSSNGPWLPGHRGKAAFSHDRWHQVLSRGLEQTQAESIQEFIHKETMVKGKGWEPLAWMTLKSAARVQRSDGEGPAESVLFLSH